MTDSFSPVNFHLTSDRKSDESGFTQDVLSKPLNSRVLFLYNTLPIQRLNTDEDFNSTQPVVLEIELTKGNVGLGINLSSKTDGDLTRIYIER